MFPHNYYNNKQNRNKKSCALPFKKGKTKLRKNSHQHSRQVIRKNQANKPMRSHSRSYFFVFLKKRYPTSAPPQIFPLLHTYYYYSSYPPQTQPLVLIRKIKKNVIDCTAVCLFVQLQLHVFWESSLIS